MLKDLQRPGIHGCYMYRGQMVWLYGRMQNYDGGFLVADENGVQFEISLDDAEAIEEVPGPTVWDYRWDIMRYFPSYINGSIRRYFSRQRYLPPPSPARPPEDS